MTRPANQTIADSFPANFEQARLDIEISLPEFKVFENGIRALSMDEKWNIFVINNILYLARSWTNFCIYKIYTKQQDKKVILTNFQVNRNDDQYKSKDIEFDTILLKEVLQVYLNREDIYIDPKLELPLIKATIEKYDPHNECKKSIGSNNAGLTRQIHDLSTTHEQQEFYTVIGWETLKNNISSKPDDEPLTSLYLQNRKNNASTTFYFDKDATKLLGQITFKNKMNSIDDIFKKFKL
jgi:hypothetical protein